MALDVEKARAAGYSDAEIVDYLSKSSTLDVNKARKAGYADDELIQYLSRAAPAAPALAPTPAPTAVKPPEPRPEDQSVLRQFADVPLKVEIGRAHV